MNSSSYVFNKRRFDLWKIGILAVFVWYFLGIASNPAQWSFLDNVNLLMHEAGHFIFMIFGNRFLFIAGGTIMQIAMPLIFVLYFYFSNQKFSSALAMFWLGQSFLNISVYAGDAVAKALPLLGGDSDGHDWYNMLSSLGLLSSTDFIASAIRSIGVIIILAAIILSLFFSQKEKKELIFFDV